MVVWWQKKLESQMVLEVDLYLYFGKLIKYLLGQRGLVGKVCLQPQTFPQIEGLFLK